MRWLPAWPVIQVHLRKRCKLGDKLGRHNSRSTQICWFRVQGTRRWGSIALLGFSVPLYWSSVLLVGLVETPSWRGMYSILSASPTDESRTQNFFFVVVVVFWVFFSHRSTSGWWIMNVIIKGNARRRTQIQEMIFTVMNEWKDATPAWSLISSDSLLQAAERWILNPSYSIADKTDQRASGLINISNINIISSLGHVRTKAPNNRQTDRQTEYSLPLDLLCLRHLFQKTKN